MPDREGRAPPPRAGHWLSLQGALVLGQRAAAERRWRAWSVEPWVRKAAYDTPLHCAARAGDAGTVQDLLDEGGAWAARKRPDMRNGNGASPLELAASGGHAAVLAALLRAGAATRRPALLLRALQLTGAQSAEAAQVLAAEAVRRGQGRQALLDAATFGRLRTLEALLDAGADARAFDDWSPLHQAAKFGHADCLALLLRRGARLCAYPELHLAAMYGHARCVTVLLAHGASVAARDEYSRTALHHAAANGHGAVVRILLAAGADQTVRADVPEPDSWVWAVEYADRDPPPRDTPLNMAASEEVRALLRAATEGRRRVEQALAARARSRLRWAEVKGRRRRKEDETEGGDGGAAPAPDGAAPAEPPAPAAPAAPAAPRGRRRRGRRGRARSKRGPHGPRGPSAPS